jgi:hypothetical protein
MAKKKINVAPEDVERINELRKELNELQNRGTFKGAYSMLRKGTVEIAQEKDKTDAEKKKALTSLMDDVADFMNGE